MLRRRTGRGGAIMLQTRQDLCFSGCDWSAKTFAAKLADCIRLVEKR